MSMDFTKFNKVNASFKNAKKDLPFRKVDTVDIGTIYRVNGLFGIQGKYGLRYFASLEHNGDLFNFDLPTNQNETCKAICSDKDLVDAINGGFCGLIITTYFSKKFNRECVNVEWVNLEENVC